MWGKNSAPLIRIEDLLPLEGRLAVFAGLQRPIRLAEIGEDLDSFSWPRPEDLPEIKALLGEGWELAPTHPPLAFLPAVWPDQLRGWVRDRVPRVWLSRQDGGRVVPQDARDRERETEGGVWVTDEIPPPDDWQRIWLLRSPVAGSTVDELVQLIVRDAHRLAQEQGFDDAWRRSEFFVASARAALSTAD